MPVWIWSTVCIVIRSLLLLFFIVVVHLSLDNVGILLLWMSQDAEGASVGSLVSVGEELGDQEADVPLWELVGGGVEDEGVVLDGGGQVLAHLSETVVDSELGVQELHEGADVDLQL